MSGISQAVDNLTKAIDANASQLTALSRTVEQLSGQLISEAKRNRQQQELLEKIWEKVNSPPQDVTPAVPRSGASHPKPPPTAVPRKVSMLDSPAGASTPLPPPPPPSPPPP